VSVLSFQTEGRVGSECGAARAIAAVPVALGRPAQRGAGRGLRTPPRDALRLPISRRGATRCAGYACGRRSGVCSIVHRCVRSAAVLVGRKRGGGGVVRCRRGRGRGCGYGPGRRCGRARGRGRGRGRSHVDAVPCSTRCRVSSCACIARGDMWNRFVDDVRCHH